MAEPFLVICIISGFALGAATCQDRPVYSKRFVHSFFAMQPAFDYEGDTMRSVDQLLPAVVTDP